MVSTAVHRKLRKKKDGLDVCILCAQGLEELPDCTELKEQGSKCLGIYVGEPIRCDQER